MTMSSSEVARQVLDYLAATECIILEKSPAHVTVKLSPRADRMLTDRPYYWGFVDRTGAEPQTLSFTFVFDPEKYDRMAAEGAPQVPPRNAPGTPQQTQRAPAVQQTLGTAPGEEQQEREPHEGMQEQPQPAPQEGILARYFGVAPMVPRLGPGLIRREDVTFGSRRLRQIWAASREEGRMLQLFEQPGVRQRTTLFSAAYEPWLAVCFKVGFRCDLKREELHMLGVSLLDGRVAETFDERLNRLELTPRLPENVHIEPAGLTLEEGAKVLEQHLTDRLAGLDYGWAEAARSRLAAELELIDGYYAELLKEPDEEKRAAVQEQYDGRRRETLWQYEPHIDVTALVCGLFYLRKSWSDPAR
ncbi:YqhG family protein [Paenibacillus glufosinatiresistens]|uniref:YqhG family protein n=1 Tax=Paenibacillus glufosinatiresistens TaxID=3070657 RepID=UPI00286DE6B2|nr:YqhG family protein [Paenibacillus sp. YX.27]